MRILALHGYHMNGIIMKKMCVSLLKRMDHNVNLITPNGPFNVNPHLKEITKYYYPPYFCWLKNDRINLDELSNLNKIDGILGFSQGVSILNCLVEHLEPKFVISISGVDRLNYNKMINVPNIHIIGKNDPYFENSIKLTRIYRNPIILYHNKGHQFPSDINIYKKINNFINNNI